MNDSNVSINGFNNCERNDTVGMRRGGVVCFVKCEIPYIYTRLIELENDQFEVLWVRMRPFKMPRKCSCIITSYTLSIVCYANIQKAVL